MALIAINFADKKFKKAQHYNTWSMYHTGKVDRVIEYGPQDIDPDFAAKHREILSQKRGFGYWLWKPYIIQKTLREINEGDYLFYIDAGTIAVQPVSPLIDAMNAAGQAVMAFELTHPEKNWTKRDAFVLMDCDAPEFFETPQRLSGYIVLKNCEATRGLVAEWLHYMEDPRIVTDMDNALGLPNHEGFQENRHDQTVWSLLTKKHGIPAFRDPSQYGEDRELFSPDTQQRSPYQMTLYSHRNPKLTRTTHQLQTIAKKCHLWRALLTLKHPILAAKGKLN